MSQANESKGQASLSPARLGEIVAHFAFYEADPHAEILAALGYPPEALEQVESGRARLRWALDGGIREGGIDNKARRQLHWDLRRAVSHADLPECVARNVKGTVETGVVTGSPFVPLVRTCPPEPG